MLGTRAIKGKQPDARNLPAPTPRPTMQGKRNLQLNTEYPEPGEYELAIDEKTLPEFAVLNKPVRVSVSVQTGEQSAPVNFQFEIRKPEKPVRTVLEKK